MSLLYREDAYSYARQTYATVSPTRSPVAVPQNPTVSTNRHVKPTTKAPMKASVATPPVPVLKDVSAACEADEKTDASVAALVREIAIRKASGTESALIKVPPTIWPRLYETISEQERAKLEYCPHIEILTVTWPSDAHESFKFLIGPFVKIAEGTDPFTWETNTEIQIPRGLHKGEKKTPDFALRRELSDQSIEFPIVVESAFSQSLSDLDEKVEMYLTRPDVECVVGLHFKTPQFNNPPPSATKEDPVDSPTFTELAQVGGTLGPIRYLGHVWAPAITGLVIILWIKGNQPGAATREEWDIFPTDNDADLRKRQKEVVKILRKVARGVIGKDEFKLIFRDKHGFNINWDSFYPDLGRRLMSDAFKRYFAWSTEPDDSVIIEIDRSSARKRTLDLYGADSDDSEEEAVEQPPQKVFKLQSIN
ncbi:hypothetical protein B0H19DRAFT_1377906 [Mycena capillaripes]|nr:hypothetical protein B0H19DRAFT_1377906 [Mycena capillaripes]